MSTVYAHTSAPASSIDLEDHFLYELVNGELVPTCAPKPDHQRLCRKLLLALIQFVEEHQLGEIFYAPVSVTLDHDNIPQPDMVFVSKEKAGIIMEDGIVGVPDAIIEVLSPGSVAHDRIEKMKLYKRLAVPEYWIVDPLHRSVEVYDLSDGDVVIYSYAIENGAIESKAMRGLTLPIETIFC